MRLLRFLWRLADAAGMFVLLASILAGAITMSAAALYGAFEGLPRLAQVFAAVAVFAASSVAVLEVIQYGRLQAGRFRRPQLQINSGTGFEFIHTFRPLDGRPGERVFDELIQLDFPQDRVTAFHTLKLKVAEVRNARAEKVLVRISQVKPPPESGQYSLPIPLPLLPRGDSSTGNSSMEPGEVRYVALLHFSETAEGRTGLAPAVPWALHNEFVFEVEALVDGKRSSSHWFGLKGHLARDAENKLVVLGLPEIEEA
jgi:hypothetical protein